jgi:hypothetical protein
VLPAFELSDLPGEWTLVLGTAQANDLEQELQREVPDGHLLKGRSVAAVAVRRQHKDTVFWLPDASQWALVHLTRNVETDARWPSSFVTPDWQALAAELA